MQSESKKIGTIAGRLASKPVVAIVGRQNVGKSTLLNRVLKKRMAIVSEIPGTTRDRIMADVTWNDAPFILVDTGGIPPKAESEIDQAVMQQIDEALGTADVIIFLTDVKEGVTPYDSEIAARLHRTGKPVLLVVNKVDNSKLEADVAEFYRLGLGEPIAISAYHNEGMDELMDKIVSLLPEKKVVEEMAPGVKIAIVGRPGVGKSLLLNALLGEERAIVTSKPGTTRDTIDSLVDFQGQNVLLIDTAGIRRRGQIAPGVEKYSVIRSMEAIDRADVALLVLDATEAATAQDTHIAGYIKDAWKGIVLLVNKWDLVDQRAEKEYTERIREEFNFAPYAPVLFISAKTKWGLEEILPEAIAVFHEREKRVPQDELNDVFLKAINAHVPPHAGKKQLKLFSAAQTGINPPTFTFYVNDPTLLHFSYQRYLENQLRAAFGFTGTPMRLDFKARG
jgi:GTP-binding protein